MIKNIVSLWVVVFINAFHINAQKQGGALLDSLVHVVPNLKDDSIKVKTLYHISTLLYSSNPELGIEYANKVLSLSEKINFKTGFALGNGALGINYSMGKNNSELGLKYLLKSLHHNTENNDIKGIASSSANIANIYAMQGNFNLALEYYGKALKNHEQINNQSGVANSLTNMANIYEDLLEYDKALQFHERALLVFRALNKKDKEAIIYSNMGNIYTLMKDSNQAKQYYQDALKLYSEQNNKLGISTIYTSIAGLEVNYHEAIQKYMKAYEIRKEFGGKNNLHYIYSGLANAYFHLANKDSNNQQKLDYLKQAKLYLDSSIAAAETTKLMPALSKDYLLHFKIDSISGDYKSALTNFMIANSLKDSLLNEKHYKKMHETQLDYEYHKKKIALEAEKKLEEISNQKKLELKDLEFEYKRKQDLAKSEEEKKKLRFEEELKRAKINFDFLQKQKEIESEHQRKELLQRSLHQQQEAQFQIKQLQLSEKAKQQRYALLSGFALISLLGLFLFFMNRQKQRTKRKQEMEKMKLRISHDLHDDIGSTLNNISLFAEVAKKRIQKNEDIEDLVNKISGISKEMMSKMGDIVWSLKAENGSIEKLKERLFNYCSQYLTPLQIEYSFDISPVLYSYPLNSEMLKEIYLISKEAIHNSMKYAACTHISIQLYKQDQKLILNIKDDGIGFDTSKPIEGMGGAGINNMKARANHIGAEIDIQSSRTNGTEIRLFLSNDKLQY